MLLRKVVLLTVLATTLLQPCWANSSDRNGSISAAQARKDKLFIANVTAFPETFKWQGHEVSVREAWIEHAFSISSEQKVVINKHWNFLCFILNFDGARHATKFSEKTQLEFILDDPTQKRIQRYGDITKKESAKVVVFGHGARWDPVRQVRYSTTFSTASNPSEIKIRALTVHQDYNKWLAPNTLGRTENLEKSDIVLTFKLP